MNGFVWTAVGQQRCAQYWQLIDRIIQQIVLQTKEGDPDVSPLELDVKKLVKQYVFYFTSMLPFYFHIMIVLLCRKLSAVQ